jgi:methanesulfonate monooxygenase small subunit
VNVSENGKSAEAVSCVSIYVTMLDGANAHLDSGETRLFCVGKYHDRLNLEGGRPLLQARNLRLDTRRMDRGSHAVL